MRALCEGRFAHYKIVDPSFRNWFVGPATSVIDVREEMWRFFRRFTRPEAAGLTATTRRVAAEGG